MGTATSVPNPELRAELAAQFFRERDLAEPLPGFEEQELFEFGIGRCLRTVSTGHGDPNPTHIVWRAPGGRLP